MNGTDDFIGRLEATSTTSMAPRRCPITSGTRSMPSFQGSARFVPARVRGDCSPCCPTPRPAPGGDSRRRRSSSRSSSAGAIFANRNQQGFIGAPASPSPTVAPTASPTPATPSLGSAQMASCGDASADCIKPGRYTLNAAAWPATVIFDVPEGWWNYHPGDDIDGRPRGRGRRTPRMARAGGSSS